MKKQPPTTIERFLASCFRMVYKKLFGLKREPGDHSCWKCSLYDPTRSVCLIVIDRGKHAPRDERGFRITELRRVWPFDFCVRFLDKKLGRLVVFDPDAPEHVVGKKELKRIEEEARRRREHGKDQKPIGLLHSIADRKKASAPVSIKEIVTRGDSWLSISAEDAGGQPPTKRN